MKVKELIEQLQYCDPEAIACIEEINLDENPSVKHYECVEAADYRSRNYYDEWNELKTEKIVVII